MRRVDSFTSASSVAVDSVLATHSRPGSSAASPMSAGGPLAPADVDAGGGERRGDQPVALDAVLGQPRRQRLLVVGHAPAGPATSAAARPPGAARRAR